jgi:integrase
LRGWKGAAHREVFLLRGTDGSNLSPSSGESDANHGWTSRFAARPPGERPKVPGADRRHGHDRQDAPKSDKPTFREAVELYLADPDERDRWKDPDRTSKGKRQEFELDAFKESWADGPVDAVTWADIRRLIDGIRRRAPIKANRHLSTLKRFFGWYVKRRLIGQSPCADIDKPARETESERVLSEDEIRLFWSAAEAHGGAFRDVFRLLLITAQRESEVGKMRGREVHLGKRTWVIPPERAKNKKGSHEVTLSELGVEILEPRLRRCGDGLVFPSVKPRKENAGRTAISGYSKAKARVDQAMGDVEPFVLHDLRRTVATQMAELGIAPQVVDRGVLNHQSGVIRGVARVYNRYTYAKEAREALLAWGERLRAIVRAPPGASEAPRPADAAE